MDIILGLLLALCTFFVGVIANDVNSIKRVTYNFKTNKIKKNLKIALLADLHGKDFGNDNEKLIALIDEAKPDIIVMAGDIISAKLTLKKESAISLCKKLADKYPVYYGIGNHENCLCFNPAKFGYSLDELKQDLKTPNLNILDNEKTHLDEYGIDITGLNLPKEYFEKIKKNKNDNPDLSLLIGKKENFELLIGHCPDFFEIYAKRGSELVVSGHLHGGVMGMPGGKGFISPKFRFFPKYAGGLFKKDSTRMVVSRGLGMHTIPIRIFNPSELVFINLIKK